MKHMCHTLGYCQEVPNAKAKCSVSTLTAHFHRLALVVDLPQTFSFTYGIETSGLGSGERLVVLGTMLILPYFCGFAPQLIWPLRNHEYRFGGKTGWEHFHT